MKNDSKTMEPKSEKEIREEKVKFWQDFWPSLQQTTRETENHIDKKIYGISVGGIGIEVTCFQFLETHVSPCLAWTSGILFVLTLFLNIFSHVKSLQSQKKEREAISLFIMNNAISDDSYIYDVIEDENRAINCINNVSIYTMLFAVICLLFFVFLKILYF